MTRIRNSVPVSTARAPRAAMAHAPHLAYKPVASAVALALLSLNAAGIARADGPLPTGGNVTGGTATITSPNATTVLVNQTSMRAATDWQTFNVGSGNTFRVDQPSAAGVHLARVVGGTSTTISPGGTVSSNGALFLLNPNGVLIAQGATVDVGGLVAGAVTMSPADFMRGNYALTAGSGSGTMVNEATITVPKGGYVAFVGKQVHNRGTIVANAGSVALGAGESMLLDFDGDGLLNLKVNAAAAGAQVTHGGLIQADGGRVVLTARAKNALTATALNVDGIITARGMVERNGQIVLDGGSSGVTRVAGTLDASSNIPGQKGGDIRVLGEYVGLFGNAKLDASGAAGGGTVLVGGDFQGNNPDVFNAFRTYAGADTQIKADAITVGDGGKVVVWSDDATQFFGNISARGGALGGNGGFAEVSGKDYLFFKGRVDLGAAKGEGGTLLLDPSDVAITRVNTTAGDDSTGGAFLAGVFTPVLSSATADIDAIEASLNAGTSVDVRTNSVAAGTGDITIATNQTISKTGTGAATLRLNAERNIIVQQGVTIQQATNLGANDKLNVVFNADSDANGTGRIDLQGVTGGGNGIAFTTNGGNITLGGRDTTLNGAVTGVATGGSAVNERAGVRLSFANLNAGAGSITIRGQGGTGANADGVTMFDSTVRANGGITIEGTGGSGGSANVGVTMGANSLVISGGAGAIAITGSGGTGGSNQGGIVVAGGADVTSTGTGTITLTGAAGAGTNGNTGVNISDAGTTVTSVTGNIIITGTGGGTGLDNQGVALFSSGMVSSTGSASIAITGTGAGAGINNYGVLLSTSATLSSTVSGPIAITGTGASGAPGIFITNAGTSINAAGAVTLTADSMALGGTTTGANVTLQPKTLTQAIDLGGADAAGVLGIDSTEFNTVTTTGGTGTVTIGRDDATGGITITTGAINNGANATTLVLRTGGAITQTTGSIVETNLGLVAGTRVTMTNAGNNVANLTGVVTGTGNFSYTDADTFSVVGNAAVNATTTTGITVNNGSISLTGTGVTLASDLFTDNKGTASTVTITGPVTINAPSVTIDTNSTAGNIAGNVTFGNKVEGQAAGTNTLIVDARSTGTGGAVTFGDTVGAVTRLAGLAVGGASVSFTGTNNNVDTLAATLTGAASGLTYVDADALTVGTVGSFPAGITTNNGAVSLTSTAGGTLNIGAAISSTGGTITLNSGDAVTVGALVDAGSGKIAINANTDGAAAQGFSNTAAITTTSVATDAVTIKVNAAGGGAGGAAIGANISAGTGATGTITIDAVNSSPGGGAITRTAGTLTANAVALNAATGIGSASAMQTAASTLSAVNTVSGNIGVVNTGNPLTITGISNSGGGSDTVNNAGAISITGTIAAAGGGGVNLTATGASGSITESGAGLINTSGTLTTNSVTGETLNGANTVGAFNATNSTSGAIALTNTGDPLTITSISQSGSGSVTVNNTGGVVLNGTIVATGSTVRLNSTGSIADAGSTANTIAADTLITSSAGGTRLTATGNNFSNYNATNTTSGDIRIGVTASPFTITGLSQSGGGGVNIQHTAGQLFIAAPMIADGGVVAIISGGSVTETGTGRVSTTGEFGVASAGGATLNGANTVGAFSATNNFGGNVALTNAAPTLTITSVSQSGGGGLTVNNTGAIAVTGLVTAGSGGAINLTASGALAESGVGRINTTGTLTTNSAGGTTLLNNNAVTSFNATNTTSGDLQLANTAATLTITGINQTGGGNVTVGNTGALTTSGAITTAANGNIALTATGGTETIGLGAPVTAGGSGIVGLTATGPTSDVLLNATVSSTSGAITVNAGRDVGFGNISTSGNVTLNSAQTAATGTIIEQGAISGALLTTNSKGGTLLLNSNTVTSFNATNSVSGNVQFDNTAPTLTITGIDLTAGSVRVSNTGAVTTTGAITTAANGNILLTATGGTETIGAAVTAGGSGTVGLTATGATSDVLLNATASSTSGAITVNAGRNVTLNAGNLSTAGNVTINSSQSAATGAISEAGAGTISGALLTTNSKGGTTLNGANTVGTFNATNTTNGDIAFTNTAGTLTISGISESGGGNVTVSNTGAITTSGAITTAANGNIALTASGTETIGAAVTAGGSGTVGLTATGAASDVLLNANNVGSTSGAITANAGRNVTVNAGGISTGGNVTLNAAQSAATGTIAEAGAGTITGALLTTNSKGGTTLNNGNIVGIFNATNATSGNIELVNTVNPLTIAGIAQTGGGDVTVTNTGALVVGGNVTAGAGNVTLTAAGANNRLTNNASIVSTTSVTLNADQMTLNGAGGSTIATTAGGTGKVPVVTLRPTSANQQIELGGTGTDAAGKLALSQAELNTVHATTLRIGRNDAPNASGAITVASNVVLPAANADTLHLITGSSITGTAGGISVSGLVLEAASANLANPANDLITLAANITPAGNAFTYSGDVNAVIVGSLDGINGITTNNGNVTLGSSGALSITQPINAGTAIVTLNNGSVTQAAAGIITAGTLTGNVTTSAILDQNNAITNLGAFTTNGNFTLNDASGGLTLTGAVNAGTGAVSLTTAGGALALGANNVTGQGVSLTGTGVTQSAASTVNAGAGTLLVDANDGAINLAGTLTTTNATGTAVQIIDSAAAALGNINAATGTLVLGGVTTDNLSGAVTQNAGTLINAATVTGNAGTSVTLGNANTIVNLGAFTSNGNLTLNDTTGGLTLTGAVNAGPGAVSIATAGGALALGTNNVSAQGVSLTGTGVTQAAGSTVNAGAGTILVDGNDGAINLAGALTTTNTTANAVQIIDATTLALPNITTAAAGTVTLGGAAGDNLSGAVTQNGTTVINTGTLTGNTGGTVTLTNNNTITNLGTFTSNGNFTLNDITGGLVLAGAINAGTGAVSIATVGQLLMGGNNVTGQGVSLIGTGVTQSAASTVNAGAGTIFIDGNDGAINLAGTLTTTNATATAVRIIDASTVALPAITAASGTVVLGEAGADNLSGAVTQNGTTVINANTLKGVAGSTIALGNNNTIVNLGAFTSNGSFTLNDTTGGLTLTGNVAADPGAIAITTAGGPLALQSNTVSGIGGVTLTGAGVTSTGIGNQITTFAADNSGIPSGAVQVTATGAGAINLASDVVTRGADSTGGATGSGGDVTLTTANGAIAVARVVSRGGDATAGNVAGGNAGTITYNVGGANTITLSGDQISRGGDAAGTGNAGIGRAISFGRPTLLATNVNVNTRRGAGAGAATAGAATFQGTVDSATAAPRSLTVTTAGNTTFIGAVGGTNALATLSTDGGGTTAIDGGGVRTTGVQTYDDAVLLGANAALTSTGAGALGDITFARTVTSPGTPRSLLVTTAGTTTFSGTVGAGVGNALLSVTTDQPGTTAINGGAITTATTQAYNDAVTLGADATLTSTGAGAAGNITFAGTLTSPTIARSVAVNTAGTTTFLQAVGAGANNALASLTTNAGGSTDINGGSVTTTGTQTYNDAVTLSADATLTSTGAGAAGDITFVTTLTSPTTARNLIVQTAGTTTFGGGVGTGAGNALRSVTTDQPGTTAINGGAITTTTTQTYNDVVTLGADAVLTSAGAGAAGNVSFAAALTSPTTARSLTVNTAGATTFARDVGTGAGNALLSVTTDQPGTTAINGGAITTTGNQSFGDAVTLGANVTLTSTGGNVAFANTIDADAAASNRTLTVNATAGSATFSGNIGTTALADLHVNAGSILFNAAGAQTVNVSAQGGNTATFNGPVVLGQSLTVNTDGAADNNVTFTNTVNADTGASNRTLTVSTGTGTSTFQNGTGSPNLELAALTLVGAGANVTGNILVNGGGNVDLSALGNITFSDNARIDTDRTGGSTAAGSVLFAATTKANPAGGVSGASTWTIDATADGGAATGNVALGSVGDVTPLKVFNVLGDKVTVPGRVQGRQVFITANNVMTMAPGIIVASQEFGNNSDAANAAVTLKGLTTAGIFGTVDNPIQIQAPGLFVVNPNASNTLPIVFLGGDPNLKPVYEFAADPSRRVVLYNGVAPDSPQSRAAIGAALAPLREVLSEVLLAGFAKENIRRQLVQGQVLETGLARPGIDEFTGEGVTAPNACQGSASAAAAGDIACQ
jgi:hypothetical protein